jgi:glycerol-3-phosphate acyltransferase PlsY
LALISPGVFSIEDPNNAALGFSVITVLALSRRLIGQRSDLAIGLSNFELVINRLLFDRDIRDRLTWISRTVSSNNKSLS